LPLRLPGISVGARRLSTPHYVAILGCAYARANRKDEANKILNDLIKRSEQELVSAFDIK